MNKKVKKAETLADDLGDLFNSLVNETSDLDLKRLYKQLEADMMDIRHKIALAAKITGEDKN
jgi:hypothetical protein